MFLGRRTRARTLPLSKYTESNRCSQCTWSGVVTSVVRRPAVDAGSTRMHFVGVRHSMVRRLRAGQGSDEIKVEHAEDGGTPAYMYRRLLAASHPPPSLAEEHIAHQLHSAQLNAKILVHRAHPVDGTTHDTGLGWDGRILRRRQQYRALQADCSRVLTPVDTG